MKKIKIDSVQSQVKPNIWIRYSEGLEIEPANKENIINHINQIIRVQDKYLFYPLTGEILEALGFNSKVTRDGETNNRSDAFLIEDIHSVPIEIKSPTEVLNINIKSVRQALENKIILLSRKFYPTEEETSSISIGYLYPEERSDVYELITNIKNTYNINIGIITIKDLLKALWEKDFENIPFAKERILFLNGRFT